MRFLLSLAIFAVSALQAQTERPRQYMNKAGSFSLGVPPQFTVYEAKDQPHFGPASYIPVCRSAAFVCVAYPENRLRGTNFEAATLQVTKVTASNSQSCLNLTNEDTGIAGYAKAKSRAIGGITFLHATGGDAAMSHDLETNLYRGYINGECFQLEIDLAWTVFGVYEPGTIQEFTSKDKQQVMAAMNSLLDSFRVLSHQLVH